MSSSNLLSLNPERAREQISQVKSKKSAPLDSFFAIDLTLVRNASLSQKDRTFSPTRSEPRQIISTTMKCHTPSSFIHKHQIREDFNVQEDEVTSLKHQLEEVMNENERTTAPLAVSKQRANQNELVVSKLTELNNDIPENCSDSKITIDALEEKISNFRKGTMQNNELLRYMTWIGLRRSVFPIYICQILQ